MGITMPGYDPKFRSRHGRKEAQKAQNKTGWTAFGGLGFVHPAGGAFVQ
jgi:hypothetical protein